MIKRILAAFYLQKMIQDYYVSASVCKAQLYAMGHDVHSQGLVIHPDGTAHHYVTGDLRPEVRAKIEAKIKAEQEEKTKRRQMYQELGKKAVQRRREAEEQQNISLWIKDWRGTIMSVAGINGTSNYPVYTPGKTVKNISNGDLKGQVGQMGQTGEKTASPKDMTLEEYKAYFKKRMDDLYTHPSQRNMHDVIVITDAAYKRMQTDPEYEQKILDALAKNKAVNFGNYIPEIAYTHIDDTWEGCYGYTKGMKENSGYGSRAVRSNSSDKKRAEQKKRIEEQEKKLLEKKRLRQTAYEKAVMEKKITHQRLLAEDWALPSTGK